MKRYAVKFSDGSLTVQRSNTKADRARAKTEQADWNERDKLKPGDKDYAKLVFVEIVTIEDIT